MSALPCPVFNPCSPCPEGSPFFNASAEAPDIEKFFAIVHFYDTPPMGGSWLVPGCVALCESTISQEDADLCALRQAQLCVWTNGGIGPGGWTTPPTIGHPNGSQRTVFSNKEQTCDITCSDGSPFTFTVPAGLILSITSQADADEKAHDYACQQADVQKICLGELVPSFACVNTFYSANIVATGFGLNDPPDTNSWTIVAGSLPPGLTFHGGDIQGGQVTIDGTPTILGSFTFTVQVESDTGITEKTYTITVGGITTGGSLPDGTAGTAYGPVTLSTTGMTAPITWTVLVGPLPSGLTLNPTTGEISGSPDTPGTYAFTIQAEDSAT